MTITMEVARASIQASVLFSIFHQYQRRSDSCSTRLVGALVGRVSVLEDNFTSGSKFGIEFTSCFPVPHSEVGEEISINSEYFKNRLDLHKKGHGKDTVLLGWYSMQDANGLPKDPNTEAFAKNSEFIKDYFVREVSLSGVPAVAHLDVTLAGNGQLSYKVTCSEVLKAVHHAGPKPRFVLVPASLGYGMPELQACKNINTTSTYRLYALVNLITQSLFGAQRDPNLDGSLLLPLKAAAGSSLRHRELLLRELEALESSDANRMPQKVERVLQMLGRTSEAQAECRPSIEDSKALRESLLSLDEKLTLTRTIFMARPFTSS